jgi:hypothetical protein
VKTLVSVVRTRRKTALVVNKALNMLKDSVLRTVSITAPVVTLRAVNVTHGIFLIKEGVVLVKEIARNVRDFRKIV